MTSWGDISSRKTILLVFAEAPVAVSVSHVFFEWMTLDMNIKSCTIEVKRSMMAGYAASDGART